MGQTISRICVEIARSVDGPDQEEKKQKRLPDILDYDSDDVYSDSSHNSQVGDTGYQSLVNGFGTDEPAEAPRETQTSQVGSDIVDVGTTSLASVAGAAIGQQIENVIDAGGDLLSGEENNALGSCTQAKDLFNLKIQEDKNCMFNFKFNK